MISQSLYRRICLSCDNDNPEMRSFRRPYVLVINRDSGQGFYLDRKYRHIIDVDSCTAPEGAVRVSEDRNDLQGDMSSWLLELYNYDCDINITIYWLY